MADLLIENAGQIVTCDPLLFDSSDDGGRSIGLMDGGDILISEGRIQAVGDVGNRPPLGTGALEVLDASGMVVLPGLVDCHTHTVFAGTREKEYEMRISGASYMEIAEQGGGISSTVAQVRRTSEEELVNKALPRLRSMLRCGTTTVEVKSGYGLDLDNEIKMLRAIAKVGEAQPIDVVPTFLGAHEFPPEYRNARDRYVALVLDEMIPAVCEGGLAEFCDVFCEQGIYTAEQARLILECGKDHGLKPMIHADEFAESGAAEIAAEVGAVCAGHLGFASEAGLTAMKRAGTVAVLLPGVGFGLAEPRFADARRMLDLGLDVALATDFNPGSSMVNSLLIISSLACSFMRMTPSEAVLGMTRHAAMALGREDSVGSLSPGRNADLVVFRVPDFRYIPYHLGGDIVETVIKGGKVVFNSAQERPRKSRTSSPEAG
jgi:imidazolonepropionase